MLSLLKRMLYITIHIQTNIQWHTLDELSKYYVVYCTKWTSALNNRCLFTCVQEQQHKNNSSSRLLLLQGSTYINQLIR